MQYIFHLLLLLAVTRATDIDDFEGLNDNDDYIDIYNDVPDLKPQLSEDLGVENSSGCFCRATKDKRVVACFGNNIYCYKFPKLMVASDDFVVKESIIEEIKIGDLDAFYFLTLLEIENNFKLTSIEPGAFRNLTKLQALSISNAALYTLDERAFEGLLSLRNLSLFCNKFINIFNLTPAFNIPKLESLNIAHNVIKEIPGNAFETLESSCLRKLVITKCSLRYIHPNAFLPLRMLKELYIGNNKYLNSHLIGNFLIKMMKNGIYLTHLGLSNSGFQKQPPKKLLDIIANTTIKKLYLALNEFESITDDAFPRMFSIELLDLRNVRATTIGAHAFDPLKFPNLKVLLLGGNNAPGIHKKHYSPQILKLDLSNEPGYQSPVDFELANDTFIESTQLRVLNLAYNKLNAIRNFTFQGLEQLEYLNLEFGTIFSIASGTFKPTKRLETLNLANNPIGDHEGLTSRQFDGLNELKNLDLRNCRIKRFIDDTIFEVMPNLTNLILSKNQLGHITAKTLKPLKCLKVLDLKENLLVSWKETLFMASGVKPQQILLNDNKISYFSISMLKDFNFLLEGNTSVIDLTDNIFVCDCNLMYSKYLWLEDNGSIPLKEYFTNSTFPCSSDFQYNLTVSNYLSTIKTHCSLHAEFPDKSMLISILSLVILGLLFLISGLVYRYKTYLSYWSFLVKIALERRLVRKPFKTAKELKAYRYDAFISYSFEDRDFVLEMITNLETKPPYLKLCVSERDFEVGSLISEAILTSINESKYVVLLISNNFAQSQWCRWETQIAEYHRLFLDDGNKYDPLVLVKKGNIENKYMTPTLKYLLKTKIYLSWDKSRAEDFWKKLRSVLARNKSLCATEVNLPNKP